MSSKEEGQRERKGRRRETSAQAPDKTRLPYKVRPLERVRTRGYSLLLASKQALKRAKKDSGALLKMRLVGEKEDDNATANLQVDQEAGRGFGGDVRALQDSREPSKRLLDRRRPSDISTSSSSTSGVRSSTEKRRVPLAGDDSDGQVKKTSVSTASETDSIPSRRSSRESLSTKLSPSRTAKKLIPSTSTQAVSDEKASVPTFYPTEAEFSDPMAYISKIQADAEPQGMCRIIPPQSWKLDSNKLGEDIRVTTQVQHVHKLYKRWGPSVQHSSAINQHLLSLLPEHSNIKTTPQIGGVEVDLPQLYRMVEDVGGSKKMADKKHWAKIADLMNIPKQAKDRSVRLYDIYCRHVFPYASLSVEERKQLDSEVEAIHELQTVEDSAIAKGRCMSLTWFGCIASNVQSMWFKKDPTLQQVETEYWRLVEERKRHVSVQCSHINTRAQASGFPTRKDNSYSRHPWNLNNIPNNQGCVLKYLGPVPGVTIPTVHINMLFSTSCWSMAPHGLPFIQYQHSGAPTIWYCVSKAQQAKFRSAMEELVPNLVQDETCWLKKDWVMVNPKNLRQHSVQVNKCVQHPRQFVVVFPGAFTSSVSCGYSVSESVHFASPSWFQQESEAETVLNRSEKREMFSIYSVLCPLVQDRAVDEGTLEKALSLFSVLVHKELDLRNQLHVAGLKGEKRDVFSDSPTSTSTGSKRRSSPTDDRVCDVCGKICYLSMVLNEQGEQVLCLEHGLKHVHRRKNIKSTRLFLRFHQSELEAMLKEATDRLNSFSSSDSNGSSSNSSSSSGGGGANNSSSSGGNGSTNNSNINSSSNSNSSTSSGSKTRLNSRQASSSS
ncbi:protein jumonji [Plakobranchus ocellatus]|uniref:Protein jumonji n=1 Tax=Plakobranchus ocellatus TaxID=259542 RepID=A0AAV3ZNI7_9GAST|nr:protein jumonji [Plakobranchus ocellatus]